MLFSGNMRKYNGSFSQVI